MSNKRERKGRGSIKNTMRYDLILFCLAASSVFYLSTPAFAQESQRQAPTHPAHSENPVKLQEMQRVIEEQQRQLDAQQERLETQQKKLQELRRQVQALAEDQETSQTSVVEQTTPVPPGGVTSRRTDIHTARRDKGQPHEEWQGSFGVEALNTRFKIGGFAELDVIHDSDAIGTPGEFVTAAIVTGDATKAKGADGQTHFSVNPSRLYVETRTPIDQHKLTTFLSMDFFGDSTSTTPDPRLRQGYGEITDILFGGDLLAGQAWSTFSDLEANPDTLDFEGPNSFFGTRQPLVRWTRGITDGLKLMVAAETPDNHIIQGADSLTAWPDGVLSLVWDQTPVHLMGAFLARDLRASLDNGPTDTAFGWGGSFSGKVGMPFIAEKDFMTFSATYGEGIGSGFNDSPPDAVFDSAGTSLEAIPVFGYFASYEHWWSRQFYSVFVYGALKANNRTVQPPDSFKKTQYVSGNLVWVPNSRWLLGVEGLWGKREDKDGADGTDFRTQVTTRFTF